MNNNNYTINQLFFNIFVNIVLLSTGPANLSFRYSVKKFRGTDFSLQTVIFSFLYVCNLISDFLFLIQFKVPRHQVEKIYGL